MSLPEKTAERRLRDFVDNLEDAELVDGDVVVALRDGEAYKAAFNGGGGAVDVLRVPQYLTAEEAASARLTLSLVDELPVSVASGAYADVAYTAFSIAGGAAADIAGLNHAYYRWESPSLKLSPGIYMLNAFALYDSGVTAGTYRACEVWRGSELGAFNFDAAPWDNPEWADAMGNVTNMVTVTVAPGHTFNAPNRFRVTHILDHDAGEPIDVNVRLEVFPVARFESLD